MHVQLARLGDGIVDGVDLCPLLTGSPAAASLDLDGDGIGDPCDSDDDGDGIGDVLDKCPRVADSPQTDTDGDGEGNACDDDDDGDTVSDVDEAAAGTSPTTADTDGDGASDAAEAAAGTAPTNADDYPGHRRPAGAELVSGGGCSSSPAGAQSTHVLAALMLLALLTRAARRRWATVRTTVAVALAVPAMSQTASAQGFDSSGYRLHGLVSDGLGVRSTDLLPQFDFAVGLAYGHVADPARLEFTQDGETQHLSILDGVDTLTVLGAFGILADLQFDFELPVAVGRGVGSDFTDGAGALESSAVGDLYLSLTYRFMERRSEPVGLSLSAFVTAPTGDATSLSGAGGATGGGRLALDVLVSPVVFTVNAGVTYRPEQTVLARTAGSVFEAGAMVRLGLYRDYLAAFTTLRSEIDLLGGDSATPVEAMGGLESNVFGLRLACAGGGGFTDAGGSGDWRVLAMIGYRSNLPRDRDGDGILDADDRCLTMAEDSDGFEDADGCPDEDNDNDGLADAVDRCPREAEDRDGFEDNDGCPERDNDGDGLPDASDTCPNQPEDLDGTVDTDGCPDADNDGDGIQDAVDSCPNQAETANGFRDDDGCPDERPAHLFRKDEPIVFYDIVFKTGSAVLAATSAPVLDEVAESLLAQPETRVRIEGHTDDRGPDAKNLVLSQQRALSVLNYLVLKGIPKERLEYEGYGETRRVGDNKTDEGRAKNRRVEFHAL